MQRGYPYASGKISCGIAIPQSFDDLSTAAGFLTRFLPRAEALGYEGLWVQEQILGDVPLLEPVTLLTYAAALTSKPHLGTSVLITVIRNPVQLAKSLATLDQLSNGRLIVGVGVGGPHIPEAVFGVSSERRGRRFVEGLQVIKALWTQPRASMSGEFWRLAEVAMEPKPAQKPHPPLWFGARDALALRRAARLGDGWMGAGSSSSTDFIKQSELLQRFLDEERRDPDKFVISKRVYLAIDDDRARAERRLRDWFGTRYKNADMASHVSIWGNRAECIDKLRELERAGAKHLLLNPVFDEMEHMELLASDVIPKL
jgi:probable F420-dependent oxidoreductase